MLLKIKSATLRSSLDTKNHFLTTFSFLSFKKSITPYHFFECSCSIYVLRIACAHMWPRTAAMLKRIADSYKRDAARWDLEDELED